MSDGEGPVRDEERVPGTPHDGRAAPADPGYAPAGIPEQQARPHPAVDGHDGVSAVPEAPEQAQAGGTSQAKDWGRAAHMSEQHEQHSENHPDRADDPARSGPASQAARTDAGRARSEPNTRSDDRSEARSMFITLRGLPEGSPERAELRNQLVRMHLPLVEHLARRFRNRGEPLDDLTQVATIGLIKSVDRFDPERGVEFSTYATPTVVGEIKRHFRDKGWAVRVPRRLQELRLSLTTATAELSQQHGRSPTVHELAERLGISEEEVLEGLESANAYSTLSLDVPDTDDESPAVADTLGAEDEALEGVEYRESLKPLLEDLPPREKRILLLRFFGNMTQSQIAQEVGISQMHVSRLLARTLAQLREKLLVEE
ncbi:SigB/SigF/SigG family RNA polymerase sigma factor [Streptomyces sp. SCSIO 30461]|uniref:RNA polymerase sigma factor SigF n=1 Tax=Streptomyces sp. SCSIO 30461 TaxID=3118085 RepID=UPI0030D4B03A